ncbi:alpha-1,2-fucosyltransferase [Luteolibacter flavescens]|uniref:Alpha-1,2-fucosyltransferase n=1 Tax=Luteolibacter flavescens TaxID=1859460 RepID=A0ABT3FNJ9_9BACT|nr:alpha-1,2-fucosyltransferase [Luteolibacter flavescens]MCW1885148.1 alpha-1,2-fucosyltransferase [Luteolibacter flavescens]
MAGDSIAKGDTRMIRVVMLGRLGNNLFQYALGRVLSEKHGVPLVMDASWFNAEGWGEVKCLRDLPGPASGKARIVRPLTLASRALRKATGKHRWQLRGIPGFTERDDDHAFDPRVFDVPADALLFGYFQTPLYFSGIEASLREELNTHGLGLEKGREELAEKLRAPGSVAVHVRRGDYAGNPRLDICGPDYYAEAIRRMRAAVPGARFHIFSDDPAWCADRFRGADMTVVTAPPSQSPLVDLHLMSLAGHHVIANSSYSWWAAWLGKKEGQRVMMPHEWQRGIHAPIDEKQCDGWEIVDPSGNEMK